MLMLSRYNVYHLLNLHGYHVNIVHSTPIVLLDFEFIAESKLCGKHKLMILTFFVQ